MRANKFCEFGPGDAETWPQCMGHQNDPRTPEATADATTLDAINYVLGFLTIAHVAAKKGDLAKARKALIEARLSLEELVGAE